MARKRVGEMLIDAGVLSEADLRTALIEQKRWGGTIGRMLVEKRFIKEADLLAVLSRQFGVPIVDLDRVAIPIGVLDLVPGDLALELSVVPFAQPMKFLDVAMADPTNMGVLDELRIRTQLNIRPYLAGPKVLERAIARHYKRGYGLSQISGSIDIDIGEPPAPDLVPEPPRRHARGETRSEIDVLQDRISTLETMVARDEEVLRKLLALLIAKGVASREEILEAIR